MRRTDSREIELVRPSGLVERLPVVLPPAAPARTYAPWRSPVSGDRRRRRRPPGEPWRGRLVDRLA